MISGTKILDFHESLSTRKSNKLGVICQIDVSIGSVILDKF